MPFVPQVKIFNPMSNTQTSLEIKDFVKYLGIMIDSDLSWKNHIDFICHKISKSIGIIAKLRHYIPSQIEASTSAPGQPPGHLNFWRIFVQIPPSPGRKAVQMPPPPGELPDYCFNFSVASIMLLKLCM